MESFHSEITTDPELNALPEADALPARPDAPPEPGQITIEVAYALPARQSIFKIGLPAGTSAAEAIELSGIRKLFPDMARAPSVGVFSRKVSPDYVLKEGDRLEIYRPLLVDPKEVRRRKAAEQKAKLGEAGKKATIQASTTVISKPRHH